MAAQRRRRRRRGSTDVGKRIRSVDDVSEYAKVLVFSRNKVGKTTFAASAPKCLIVDINEEGTRSAKGTGAHVIRVTQWPEVDEVYWWLKDPDNRKKYRSVALDTLTAMQALAMRHTLQEAETRDPHRPVNMPDQRTWGKVAELMRPQILAFRNLPMHVVFTAQERRETDDDTGELVSVTADLSPGSRGTALGAVGVVGRLFKVKPKRKAEQGKSWPRRLLVGDHSTIDTGNRVDGLPRIFSNPTMADIISAYRN